MAEAKEICTDIGWILKSVCVQSRRRKSVRCAVMTDEAIDSKMNDLGDLLTLADLT